MRITIALGNDQVSEHPANCFLTRPAEGALCLSVPVDHKPARVHRNERLVSTIQHRAEILGWLLPSETQRIDGGSFVGHGYQRHGRCRSPPNAVFYTISE